MSSLNDTTLEANETWGNFLSNVVRQLWLMLPSTGNQVRHREQQCTKKNIFPGKIAHVSFLCIFSLNMCTPQMKMERYGRKNNLEFIFCDFDSIVLTGYYVRIYIMYSMLVTGIVNI